MKQQMELARRLQEEREAFLAYEGYEQCFTEPNEELEAEVVRLLKRRPAMLQ